MSALIGFVRSSIGRKYIMAATGMLLFGFLIAHMIGNLQMFIGPDAMNGYGHDLRQIMHGAGLWIARGGLLVLFVVHLGCALSLKLENKRARPVGYKFNATVEASQASRTMILTGLVILAFVIYHILHFTTGHVYSQYFDRTDYLGRHDAYTMVVLGFRQWPVAASYIIAMLILMVHLNHGLSSWLQSVGIYSPENAKQADRIAVLVSILLFLGQISVPVAVLAGYIKLPGGV